ncbi:MAG: hypothetical protein JSS87_01075 [Acidobacteria bacterium]|nr:hypothetical protein [Acidobacteriota bacterium]
MRWLAGMVLGCALVVGAQEGFGKLDPAPPEGHTVDEIIKAFGAKEAVFAEARTNYVFRQDVKFQTIDDNTGKVDGEYHQITDVGITKEGKRTENVVYAPQNTIERVIMTAQDFQDVEHRLPFVLTTEDLPDYNITYVGRQKVDELDTYVFDAEPKVMEKGRRYYKGRVWVDQKDLQIVLISGKSVPDDVRRGHENLSPPFTTYYAQVDGKYWFPIYTKAEGILHFASGSNNMAEDVHVRTIVRYSDYKQFRSTARILYNGQDITDQKQLEQPNQEPAKK